MAMIKCPECGREIDELSELCPECGYPIKKERLKAFEKERRIAEVAAYEEKEAERAREREKARVAKKNTIEYKLESIKSGFIICAIVCAAVACMSFYKAYNVKNVYRNSDTYYSSNKNAYVGGDAYNYIINGTYFTGYMALGSACTIGSIILMSGSVYVSIKKMERTKEWH